MTAIEAVGLIDLVLATLALAIVARVFVSWIDPCGRTDVHRALAALTEPIQGPIRELVPLIGGALDISCWISLFLLRLLSATLHQALLG